MLNFLCSLEGVNTRINDDIVFKSACINNKLELVKLVYEKGSNELFINEDVNKLNDSDKLKHTLLYFCCLNSCYDTAVWLHSHTNINIRIPNDIYFLLCCEIITNGINDIIEFDVMIQNNPDYVDMKYFMTLCNKNVCLENHLKLVKWMVSICPSYQITIDADIDCFGYKII